MAQLAEGIEVLDPEGGMKVTRKSLFTSVVREINMDVTPAQFAEWRSGTLIQDAFPDLTKAEREFLMTGTTQEEWDNAFGKDDHGF